MSMKKIKMFYQPKCPFCVMAFRFIDELKKEHPEYKNIELETIDELKETEVADKYDYYYVPTFYVDGKKVHEGAIYKPEMKQLFDSVIKQ